MTRLVCTSKAERSTNSDANSFWSRYASLPVKKLIMVRLSILILILLSANSAWATPVMVWSQVDGSAVNVYYSPDGKRVIPVTSRGINTSPNLYLAQNSTWITWIDESKDMASLLSYALLSKSGALLDTGSLTTQSGNLYSPAISIDPSGSRVWLVWVEYNGRRENLFASYRDITNQNSGHWKRAIQITPDSKYSANLPTITSSQLDRIEVNWMRTSPDSSESATAQVLATNWLPDAAMLSVNQIVNPGKREKYQSLSVSNIKGYGSHIKQLKSGQALSTDEQQWKDMVRNRNVITGAIHSGSGASKRVLDEFQ